MRRDAEAIIKTYLESPLEQNNVLLVQGARQVGKTYLVKTAIANMEKRLELNLEELPDIKLAIDQTKNFSEFESLLRSRFAFTPGKGELLFIDEAQESQVLGSYVRFMKESWLHTKTILTGSSMHALFDDTHRVPVGRINYLRVFPFSFREFLRFLNKHSLIEEAWHLKEKINAELHQEILKFYDNFLAVGGMPKAVEAFSLKQDHRVILNFILASQRDDFIRKEPKKSYLFLDALRGVSNHVGDSAKFTHVASNNYDAKAIVQKLIEWCLVLEVEQRGSLPTQKFLPKRYLYDTGLLQLMRDVAVPKISVLDTLSPNLRTPLGGVIENAVLQHLIKDQHGVITLSSWKKNNKAPIEVDFIYQLPNQTVAIEVKAALRLHERHVKNLFHYLETYPTARAIIVSLAPMQTVQVGKTSIDAIPAYLLEEYLGAEK